MSRIPIRARLSLLTSLVGLSIVLVVGVVLYLHTADELREGVDRSLREELAEIVPFVLDPDRSLSDHRVDADDVGLEVAQALDADGRVLDATPGASELDLVGAAGGAEGPVTIELAGVSFPVRALVSPVTVEGRPMTLAVARSTDSVHATLADLRRRIALVAGLAFVFLVTSTYAIVTLALRPVDKMRAEAAAISPGDHSRRLALPVADDELRRLGETFNATISDLEAAAEERQVFIASASHELRTPLTHLRAGLELAQQPGRSPEELRASVTAASADTTRLIDLTEGLLDLAVTQVDRVATRRDVVSVGPMLVRVIDDIGSTVPVVVSCLEDLHLSGDERSLCRAVANLVTNALVHGESPVRIDARAAGPLIEIVVTDQGPGIPERIRTQAFVPFVRADEAHQRPGAGLGLAIAAEIVAGHGGCMGHERDSTGHHVTICLPAAALS
jgi:two-component system OmpR family sensor kinase